MEYVENNFTRVKRAMENPKFKFRTIHGVAVEAGLTDSEVEAVIRLHTHEIVELYRKGKDGQRLVTTRKHYLNRATLGEKLKGVLLNRVY